MIARAAQATRLWIVTHSEALAKAIEDETGKPPMRVIKSDGATQIEGLSSMGRLRRGDEDAEV